MVRHPGNHEFPDHEKHDLDLDFLLLMSCAFIHEFPFFKIKQQTGNCFIRYLQHREKQFPEKQFLCHFRNHNECYAWILKHLQYWTSHMTLKKSNLGIHDASKHLNREINSQLEQIIFDPGIQGWNQHDEITGLIDLLGYCRDQISPYSFSSCHLWITICFFEAFASTFKMFPPPASTEK